jgi:hypothetical protein
MEIERKKGEIEKGENIDGDRKKMERERER